MPIAQLFPAVVRVRAVADGAAQPGNTGFFYLHAGRLYLVTNQHVLQAPDDRSHRDGLCITLHTDAADLTQHEELTLPLYDAAGRPRWLECDEQSGDIAALLLDRTQIGLRFVVRAFRERDHIEQDRHIRIGEKVVVVGFPDGLYDTRRSLPVAQPAVMASVYPASFAGRRVAAVDGPRLPRGASGSPVLLETGDDSHRYHLIGVYSTIDPAGVWTGARPSGLGWVWFASLIPQVLKPQ
jgi:hypothetical protein